MSWHGIRLKGFYRGTAEADASLARTWDSLLRAFSASPRVIPKREWSSMICAPQLWHPYESLNTIDLFVP